MKKLMIAAAIVCAAALSQAASISWSANSIYAPGTTAKATDYLIYCFNSADYSYESALSDLGKSNTAFISKALNSAGIAVKSTGIFSQSGLGTVADGAAMTGYMLILDAAVPTKAYITTEMTGEASGITGTAGKMAFGKLDGTGTQKDTRLVGSWQSVPEPTSGLLLLLGVAGLALRRRRA